MNKIINNGSHILRAEIAHINTPPDHFHFKLTTQHLGAKNPDEKQTQFDATMSRDQLIKLSRVIDLSLLHGDSK